jgi:tripartite-type tricarboxylate transporter receptor subunit TctC
MNLSLSRRALGASLLAAPAAAQAQAPTPTVPRLARLLAGFPAGGSVDITARVYAERLRGAFAPNVIVENRVGAAGRLAIEALRQAEPDGTTLLLSPASMMSIFPALYGDRLRYDPLTDLIPVTPAVLYPFGLAVGPAAANVRTLEDLIGFARAQRGLNYASPAAGSAPHFLGVMLGRRAGVEFNHVPYRGAAPAIQDALAGQIPATINVLGDLVPHHREGRLRILAVTSAQRLPRLPDVPTFAELGHNDLTLDEWFGFFLPARTPAPVVEGLHRAVTVASQEPGLRETLQRLELEPRTEEPAAFARRIRAEQEKWAPIVAASGFRPED